MVTFYQCSEMNCDYREWLPQRKAKPLLSFEALSSESFKVLAPCMRLKISIAIQEYAFECK